MDTVSVLVVIALLAATAVCIVAIFALVETIKTMRSTRVFVEETGGQLGPLIEKVDVTVDAVNAELMRIDAIVTTFEDVSDKVSTTSSAVQSAVSAPVDAVNAVGGRLRRAWLTARKARR